MYIYFCLNGYFNDYTGQVGLLTGTNSISEKFDYAAGYISCDDLTIDGLNIIPNDGVKVQFTSQQAIVKFTLVDKDNNAPINATSLTIHNSGENQYRLYQSYNFLSGQVYGDVTINPAGTTNVIYAALAEVKNCPLTLTATVGTDTYTYEKDGMTFSNGKYYEITVKMTKQAAAPAYTVAADATDGDKGKLICTDGHIHANGAEAECTATRVAMIAYVGDATDHATYTQGLAIALADESNSQDWSTAKSACEGKTAVTGAAWLLPSLVQWNAMFNAYGSISNCSALNTAITNAGGTALNEWQYYWSSTAKDDDFAWTVIPGYETDYIGKNQPAANTRACFAF